MTPRYVTLRIQISPCPTCNDAHIQNDLPCMTCGGIEPGPGTIDLE